jgi:hypothetical protein
MPTKIEGFLKEQRIDSRRLIATSSKIEHLRPEDRAIRLAKRTARKSEDAAKKKEGLAAKKPRSGRALTPRTLHDALSGKALSGPVKARILRAVNGVLLQKKQAAVELSALFDAPEKKPEPKPTE